MATQGSGGDAEYTLIYWPGIPGRAEVIRLLLEEAGASYIDVAKQADGVKTLLGQIDSDNLGDDLNPPPLAPPILQHGDLTISQLPNILLYLAQRHGLDGRPSPSSQVGQKANSDADADADADQHGLFRVHELVLTALDGLYAEAQETHHPIAVSAAYEEQKAESARRAADYVVNRLPKFLGYFERVLAGKASRGGRYLYDDRFTSADLALWQGVDGVEYAFPKALAKMREGGKYEKLFAHQKGIGEREKIKRYLESERRIAYANGLWRRYAELAVKE